MNQFDVAIVGNGPASATLAYTIGQCSLNIVELERDTAPYHMLRAVHLDPEMMLNFLRVCIADAIEPPTARHPGI